MRLERHLLARDTAEAERLRTQRVALVVSQRLGRGPRQTVGAELAGDGGAVFVGHGYRAQHTVLGADRHGRLDAHADGPVLDGRSELGHQQVPVRRAFVSDDLGLRRGGVVVARG